MAPAAPDLISEEMGRVYMRVIRHTLRRWRSHPMWEDLVSYCTCKVCETLARLRSGSPEEAFGVVALITRLSESCFWHSQHCDAAWRSPRSDPPREVRFPAASLDDTAANAWLDDSALAAWLRHFTVPDFAPGLVDRLYAQEVWEELRPLLNAKEKEVIQRWLTGDRIVDIAHDLGLAHQSTTWRMQSGLDRWRRRHDLPCRRLSVKQQAEGP